LMIASPVSSQMAASASFVASASGQEQRAKSVEVVKQEYVSYQHYTRVEVEKRTEYHTYKDHVEALQVSYEKTEEVTVKTKIKVQITTATEQRNEAWVAWIAAWKQALDVRIVISSQFHIWGVDFQNEMHQDKIELDTNWQSLMTELHNFNVALDDVLHNLNNWASRKIAAAIHGSEAGLHYASVEGMKGLHWTFKTADDFWTAIWGDVKSIWLFLNLQWSDFAHWSVDTFDHTRDSVINSVHDTENRWHNAVNAWQGSNPCPVCPPQPSCATGIGGNSASTEEVSHHEEHEGKHRRSHRGSSVHVSVNVE